MGMDCNGYLAVRVPTAQDLAWFEENGYEPLPEGNKLHVQQLSLTAEEHAELNQMLGEQFLGEPRQFVNTDKLEADFKVPEHYHLDIGAYDLTQEQGWVQYSSSKEGERSMLLQVKSADYLYTDGLYHVLAVVQRKSYLRKPFRKDWDTPTSRVEGDTLVLTTGNFDGANVPALNALLGIDVNDRCCKTLMPSGLELARALRAHTGNPSAWDEAVIEVLKDPRGVVYLDW
jgi:hypothetical protein